MATVKRITAVLLFCVLCFSFSSCSILFGGVDEKTAYRETVKSLVSALDAGDGDAVYELFAPAVREENEALREQVTALTLLYGGPTDKVGWDGANGGGATHENGGHYKYSYSTFPIRSGNTYYWIYLNLMYENDFDSDRIGITRLEFFTAEEYYAFYTGETTTYGEESGLYIHAEKTLTHEVRCIEGTPYHYTPTERTLNVDDVAAFLRVSADLTAFRERFGEPSLVNPIFIAYLLPEEDGELRYLLIGFEEENGRIYGAYVVGEFLYIERIYSEYG